MPDYDNTTFYQVLVEKVKEAHSISELDDGFNDIGNFAAAHYASLHADGYGAVNANDQELLYWDDASGTILGASNAVKTTDGINLPASTTETRDMKIGYGRSGNGYAAIGLVGDATYTSYGIQLRRDNSGANSSSNIIHRGTGAIKLNAYDAGSIELYTNNTKRITLDSSGNLALGSGSPSYFLDVSGNDADWIARFFNDGNNTNRYGVKIQCGADDMSSGTNYFMGFYDGDGGAEGYIRCVNGTVELAQASDINRKTAIADTKVDALNIVNNLEVKEFRFRKDGYAEPGALHPADFIAQNIQQHIPEAVGDKDGTLMMAKTALIPYLTKAIQQLSDKVEQLTEEVGRLKHI